VALGKMLLKMELYMFDIGFPSSTHSLRFHPTAAKTKIIQILSSQKFPFLEYVIG